MCMSPVTVRAVVTLDAYSHALGCGADPVRKQVAELERSYSLLESEIAFVDAGFVARPGEFFHHETRLDPLLEVGSGKAGFPPGSTSIVLSPRILRANAAVHWCAPGAVLIRCRLSLTARLLPVFSRLSLLLLPCVPVRAPQGVNEAIRELNLSVRPSKVGMGPGVVLTGETTLLGCAPDYTRSDLFQM